jgi:hypothetical protein
MVPDASFGLRMAPSKPRDWLISLASCHTLANAFPPALFRILCDPHGRLLLLMLPYALYVLGTCNRALESQSYRCLPRERHGQ